MSNADEYIRKLSFNFTLSYQMPLLTIGAYQNPIAVAMPAAPLAAAAPALAPGQGDHVFGDVIGTIETALQSIFGGGAGWQTRMQKYNSTLASLWTALTALDLGHGALPPIVNRAGMAEPDEHSHMFGGYSHRFQWQLCELVATGFVAGPTGANIEVRVIGGATKAWRKGVMARFDDLIGHLVDSTALAFYITSPTVIRHAAALVRHSAISLTAAVAYTTGHNGPGKLRVNTVLAQYASLRIAFESILLRLENEGGTRAYNAVDDSWS
ncbi:hypothetical protein FVF58_43660 [Paraburkholderia panacisoli]|uniref:Uncharacterized protein n=1 Tax=Paraburkholderia panacisoli TaxID=2603818 RepID=A0A5B0G5I5_9BURK|nr:hypothetical protein [Paraburkholderia panacisoli]KAA0998626.1 hypothetical protein FVF58_43660 [Paraburkholderia panacisoli]